MACTSDTVTVQIRLTYAFRSYFRSRIRFGLLLGLACLLGPAVATIQGQAVDPLEGIGIPTFPTQLPVESGYINPANGNLRLEISLGALVERGGRRRSIAISYDSGFWDQSPTPGYFTSWSPNGPLRTIDWQGGWHFSDSAFPGPGATFNSVNSSGNPCRYDGLPKWITYNAVVWTDQSGSTHSFPIQTKQGITDQCWDYSSVSVPSGDGFALDGSGYHMYVINFTSVTVYAPDGTQIGRPTDSNGNFTSQVNYYSPVIDTLGRTIVSSATNGNVTTYSVMNETGGTSTYTSTSTTINVSTNFHSAGSDLMEFLYQASERVYSTTSD